MSASSNPIQLPPGYDLTTGQTCAFLVNVASNMCKQWIAAGSPPPAGFTWQPADLCPVTSNVYNLNNYTFGPIIWSTFVYQDTSYNEPFGFIATDSSSGNNYLVFRGSQTLADLGMDSEVRLVAYQAPTANPPPGLEVEQGFYAVFNGLQNLRTQLQGVSTSPTNPLTITGHSLGSTLATLTVPLAVSLGVSVQQYNQASPRVGNRSFASYYGDLSVATYRLVNTADVVPKLPPFPYVPVGTEASFTASYGTEADNHDPCCCYSYAIFNPENPYNPNIGACLSASANPAARK